MPTPTLADLPYIVNVYSTTQANMVAALAAAPIDESVLLALSLTVVGDVTVPVGTAQAQRTITVSLIQPPIISSNNPPTSAGSAYAWKGSIVSSSASDDASPPGTGVQTVQVNYLDLAGAPHSEIVSLNGTTPVPMVNANKSVITSVMFLTAGSFGTSQGQLTIMGDLVNQPVGEELNPLPLVAIVPPSYYVMAGGATPDDLKQLLRGSLQATLDLPILALAPVLH